MKRLVAQDKPSLVFLIRHRRNLLQKGFPATKRRLENPSVGRVTFRLSQKAIFLDSTHVLLGHANSSPASNGRGVLHKRKNSRVCVEVKYKQPHPGKFL